MSQFGNIKKPEGVANWEPEYSV